MPAEMLVPEVTPADAMRPHGDHLSLADALDRILHRGVAPQGNLTIGLADVELLFLDLRLLLGSVDVIWPDGRPPVPAAHPRTPSSDLPPPSEASSAVRPDARLHDMGPARPASANPPSGVTGDRSPPGSSAAQGLVRLVLTLVKLLHEVLERQAVRRMEAGRLSEAQIDNLGAALFAQAEEILRLQQLFGFSDKDLSLDLGVPDGAL